MDSPRGERIQFALETPREVGAHGGLGVRSGLAGIPGQERRDRAAEQVHTTGRDRQEG